MHAGDAIGVAERIADLWHRQIIELGVKHRPVELAEAGDLPIEPDDLLEVLLYRVGQRRDHLAWHHRFRIGRLRIGRRIVPAGQQKAVAGFRCCLPGYLHPATGFAPGRHHLQHRATGRQVQPRAGAGEQRAVAKPGNSVLALPSHPHHVGGAATRGHAALRRGGGKPIPQRQQQMAAAGQQRAELLVVKLGVAGLSRIAQFGQLQPQNRSVPMVFQPVRVRDRGPIGRKRHRRHGDRLQVQVGLFRLVGDKLIGTIGERRHHVQRVAKFRLQPFQHRTHGGTNRLLCVARDVAMAGNANDDRIGRQVGRHRSPGGKSSVRACTGHRRQSMRGPFMRRIPSARPTGRVPHTRKGLKHSLPRIEPTFSRSTNWSGNASGRQSQAQRSAHSIPAQTSISGVLSG